MSFTESPVIDEVLAEAFEAISADAPEQPTYEHNARAAEFVLIVIGEQAANVANSSGIAAIGLRDAGAWTAVPGAQLVPTAKVHGDLLANVACNARGVIVLAPSDISADPFARTSLTALAEALEAQADVPVVYAVIPEPRKMQGRKTPGINVDSWLLQGSQSIVLSHLAMIWSKALQSREVRKNGGWIPLGFLGDKNFVYSVGRDDVFELSSNDLTVAGKQINIAGRDFLLDVYGRDTKYSGRVIDHGRVAGDLSATCLAVGPYIPKSARYTGVHVEPGNVLVVNGLEQKPWRTDGAEQERFGGRYHYPRGTHQIGITAQTPQASAADMLSVLEAFNTFGWPDHTHAKIAFGCLCHSYLTGASDMRVHLSISAPSGSGKTTLRNLLMDLWGEVATNCSGNVTEPAIRAALNSDCMVLVVDQANSSQDKVDAVMSSFCDASYSDTVLRANQGQGSVERLIRFTGVLLGVGRPVLNSELQRRFFALNISEPSAEVKRNPHPLVMSGEAAKDRRRELGKTLFARMVHAWPRLQRVTQVFRSLLCENTRSVDALTSVLSAYWVALNDTEVSVDEAKALIDELGIRAEEERMNETSDEVDAWNLMLGTNCRAAIDGKNIELSVGELIACSQKEHRRSRPGDYSRSLARIGMRLMTDDKKNECLYIHPNNPQFKALFVNSKWKKDDIGDLFKRLPGASPKMTSKTISINGVSQRAVEILVPEIESSLAFSLSVAEG